MFQHPFGRLFLLFLFEETAAPGQRIKNNVNVDLSFEKTAVFGHLLLVFRSHRFRRSDGGVRMSTWANAWMVAILRAYNLKNHHPKVDY
jgi:hypothetical protein